MNNPLFLAGLITTIAACSTENLLAMAVLGVAGLVMTYKAI